ncbi:MAG TPA: pitrilysin family protein [Tepidisphaeraceae bacterium]|jgi:zinc protease|nr:pitrilysin family protein [Tepidisphaeraceae bacterium]
MKPRRFAPIVLSLALLAGCAPSGTGDKHDSQPSPAHAPGYTGGVGPAASAAPLADPANSGKNPLVTLVNETESADPAQPATGPAGASGAPEMLQPRSSFTGYGAENYRLVSEKDEIVSVLKNGMVVIVKRIPSPVVAVRGVSLTGGVYEGKWLGGGLSHLLEHLVAGGSSERRTEAENRDLLQKIGNNSNAYTTEDNTSFFINTTTDHMEQAVDLVTGWMLGAKITVPEYRREYEVVQRELEMGKGEPDRQLYYLAAMNRYRVSPARVPVIGYQEVIQKLSRDDVYSYYKMAYQPNNMVFAVAGNLEPEAMLAAVQKNVAGAPPGRVFSHNIESEPPVLTPRTLVATFPKLGQAKLMLGFPSITQNDPDLFALDLLATALGAGESSLLVEELRDRQQLVSGIAATDDTPSYVKGTFFVEMQLDPDKVQQATDALLKILESVKKDGMDAGRLARAKTLLRAARVKRLETAEEIAGSLADDFRTTGDPHFSDKYLDRIDKITPQQVQAVARKYFDPGKLMTNALFPADWAGSKGLPKAEDLLRGVSPASQPAAAQPVVASAVQRVELENGTVLLLKRVTTSPTVVMSMYSLGGVTAEDEKTNGLGNLTMQMLMRGTKTRSAEQIAEFFDSIGGEMSVASGNNSWTWTASCLKADFAKAFDVYADIVNNPAFAEAEAGPLKKRVEAAIKSEDADWSQQSIRFFKNKYYGPQHSPYRLMPEGTQQNVETFTVPQMRDWYAGKVMGARRVLAIYGDVDLDKAKALAADLLGKGEKHAGAVVAGAQQPAKDLGNDTPAAQGASVNVQRVEVQKTEQDGIAGVVIGFNARPYIGDKDTYAFTMAKTVTGGFTYPTGYLFETLRGRGLVYVVESQATPGRDKNLPGTFLVFAGCDPSKVNEVVDLCLENIARLQGTPQDINETWFNRAKELIDVADAMEHETPAAQASVAALDELFGLGYAFHDQFPGKIREVQLSQVQSLARRRIRDCVVTISTPLPDVVKTKPGERTYPSFPPVDLTPRGVQHDTGAAGK